MRGLRSRLLLGVLLSFPGGAAEFSVTAFGAVADGATDATRGIQAAVDAASKAGGGVVVLPPNSRPYLIRSTLRISHSNIEIRAHGARILLADHAITGASGYAILAEGSVTTPIRHVVLRGLSLDANFFNQSNARGSKAIVFRFVEDALVEDVSITRPYVGLSFRRCRRAEARRVTVTDYAEDGLDAGGDADEVSGGQSSRVSFRSVIVRDAPRTPRDGNAFEIEDGAQDVSIHDALIENVGGNGIGIRNHAAPGLVNRTRDIEVRNTIIRGVGGDFALFARCAALSPASSNSLHRVRLVNLTAQALVAIWGPIQGLELKGGQYSSLLLGFDSPTAPARPDYVLASGKVQDVQATRLRINDPSRRLALSRVTVPGGKIEYQQ